MAICALKMLHDMLIGGPPVFVFGQGGGVFHAIVSGCPPGLPSPPASVEAAKSSAQAAVEKALPKGVPTPGATSLAQHRHLQPHVSARNLVARALGGRPDLLHHGIAAT